MSNNISSLGFNGEYLDDTLDSYHLGNGYRAYNPTTMQFSAPDDMSPFGHGGINPYVYVSCDPINNTDPTGHFLGFAGVVLSMLMPINLPPQGGGIGAYAEAVGENAMNAGINEGVDAVIELVSGGSASPAIPELNVMIAPVEHLAESSVEREATNVFREQEERALNTIAGSSRKRKLTNEIDAVSKRQNYIDRDQRARDIYERAVKDPMGGMRYTPDDGNGKERLILTEEDITYLTEGLAHPPHTTTLMAKPDAGKWTYEGKLYNYFFKRNIARPPEEFNSLSKNLLKVWQSDENKKIFGSKIGKISVFTRTPGENTVVFRLPPNI